MTEPMDHKTLFQFVPWNGATAKNTHNIRWSWCPERETLRKLQQTPGTYPRPSTTCWWRKSCHICILGYLGSVPEICWIFLRETYQSQKLRFLIASQSSQPFEILQGVFKVAVNVLFWDILYYIFIYWLDWQFPGHLLQEMLRYMFSILNKWKSSDGQSCVIGEDLNEPGRSYVWLSLIGSSFNRVFFHVIRTWKPIQESISIQRQRHPTFQFHLHYMFFIMFYPTKKNTISDLGAPLNLSLPKRQVVTKCPPRMKIVGPSILPLGFVTLWCKKTLSLCHTA